MPRSFFAPHETVIVLDFLRDVWSESDSLRLAYRLDTPEAPLEAALAAWEASGYRRVGDAARDVLDTVSAIWDDAGPDCYPDLFGELADLVESPPAVDLMAALGAALRASGGPDAR